MLTPAEETELQSLLPVARRARRGPANSPAAQASTRVNEILAQAHQRGASVRELADATHISYHSVARRLRIAAATATGSATPVPVSTTPVTPVIPE